MDLPTFTLDDDDIHEPKTCFRAHDDDDLEDPTAARVARRYMTATGRVSKVITKDGAVTKDDVIGLLAERGIEVADVKWGARIAPAIISFVGVNADGQEVVDGTVSLRLGVDGQRLVADAELVVLDDGDIPF